MAKKARGKKPKLLTRQELAAAFDVTPMTITRWENDGCPVAKKQTRGRPTFFDLEAVRAWVEAKAKVADSDVGLSLEVERARLAKAQRIKTEMETKIRRGELVERGVVVQAGLGLVKAVSIAIRGWPRRLVTAGVIPPDKEHAAGQLARELLADMANWKALSDAGVVLDEEPEGVQP